MTPEAASEWLRVLRGFVLTAIGVFMLVYATQSSAPNALVIGGGLAALGIEPALRIDEGRRRRRSNQDGEEERWSHLP